MIPSVLATLGHLGCEDRVRAMESQLEVWDSFGGNRTKEPKIGEYGDGSRDTSLVDKLLD